MDNIPSEYFHISPSLSHLCIKWAFSQNLSRRVRTLFMILRSMVTVDWFLLPRSIRLALNFSQTCCASYLTKNTGGAISSHPAKKHHFISRLHLMSHAHHPVHTEWVPMGTSHSCFHSSHWVFIRTGSSHGNRAYIGLGLRPTESFIQRYPGRLCSYLPAP